MGIRTCGTGRLVPESPAVQVKIAVGRFDDEVGAVGHTLHAEFFVVYGFGRPVNDHQHAGFFGVKDFWRCGTELVRLALFAFVLFYGGQQVFQRTVQFPFGHFLLYGVLDGLQLGFICHLWQAYARYIHAFQGVGSVVAVGQQF